MSKILVIEDDRSLSEALVYNLRREGYTPVVAGEAHVAVQAARREHPDLIVLDLMLPGGSGFDVCRDIRGFSKAPIIMLTARDEDLDRVLGLEMGADDYVTKPFSLRELLARIRANLRRVAMEHERDEQVILHYGPLSINAGTRKAQVHDRILTLQPKEFDLLLFMVKHVGIVLTRERLLADVWGHEFVGPRTVDVHVRRLRSKLQAAGAEELINTVHGVGYSFGESATPDLTLENLPGSGQLSPRL